MPDVNGIALWRYGRKGGYLPGGIIAKCTANTAGHEGYGFTDPLSFVW